MTDKHCVSGIAIFLVAIYLFSAPQAASDHDSTEFVAAAVSGAIVHPPGYPLLTSIYRLLWLVFQPASPEFLFSFVSVIFSAGAAVFIFHTLRLLIVSQVAAAAAVGIVFLSFPIWRIASSIEPFALNLLLASLVSYLVIRISVQDKLGLWVVLGACFGLGFCNHHSLVFIAPAVVFALYQKCSVRTVSGFAIGLGVCAIIPLVYFFTANSELATSWGNWASPWQQLVHHVLRADYGTLNLSAKGEASGSVWVWEFVKNLPGYMAFVFLVPMIFGFDRRLKVFLIAFLMTGVVFLLMFNLDPNNPGNHSIVARFFALPMLFLVFPLGIGWDKLARRMKLEPKWSTILVIAVLVIQWSYHFESSERRSETFYQSYISESLQLIDGPAIVISTDDVNYFGYVYGQKVMGKISDSTIIHSRLWGSDWYRKKILKQLNLPEEVQYLEQVLVRLRATQNIYFAGLDPAGLVQKFKNTYPLGPLIVVPKQGSRVKSVEDVFNENIEAYRHLSLPADPFSLKPWEKSVFQSYGRVWHSIQAPLRQLGRADLVAEAHKFARYFSGI